MTTIDVNINETRQVNSRLIPLRNDVGVATRQVSHLSSAIDPRILNRNNLRRRIIETRDTIAFVESELTSLNRVITDILNRYEAADRDLLAQVPSLELGRSGSLRNGGIGMPFVGVSSVGPSASSVMRAAVFGSMSMIGVGTASFRTMSLSDGFKNVKKINDASYILSRANDFAMDVDGLWEKGSKMKNSLPTEVFNKVGGGLSFIGGTINVRSGIQRRRAAGYSPRAVIGNAVVEAGQEAIVAVSTKKIIGSSIATGAKIGSIFGPKGTLVGGAIGGAVGWFSSRGTSHVIRNPLSTARNVVSGAASTVTNATRSVANAASSVASGVTSVGRNVVSGVSNMASGLARRLRF